MKTFLSKNNVYQEYQKFISEIDRLIIISPFIKVHTIDKLLRNSSYQKITIVTTWKVINFIQKASDVDIFVFATDNGITLLANNRIHLKLFTDENAALTWLKEG